MSRIITTEFKKLSEDEKERLSETGKDLGHFDFFEYVQKGMGLEGDVKYIFDDFNLRNIVKNLLLWDSLKTLLSNVFNLTSKKFNQLTEVQVWIRDTNNPAALNISFSIKQEKEIHDLLTILRTELENDIFSKNREQESGKIFWVAFDREKKDWLIKVL